MNPQARQSLETSHIAVARCLAFLALLTTVFAPVASAQVFVAITDTLNPVVVEPSGNAWAGAAWADMNDDSLLDLFFVGRKPVFENLGGGNFAKRHGAIKQQGDGTGTTWADYNNDGLIDCFVTGGEGAITGRGSSLYRNEGNFVFSRISTGDIGDHLNNGGWGCAFADYNNDSWVDVVVAAANGFASVTHENRLFHNNGDGTFTRIDSTEITNGLDAYTVPTWSDFDLDGDTDLFIGSGEISVLDPDNLYRNNSVENGYWAFERITTAPIATDSVDGQVWNWIDYDNDGDLDGYQTNYRNTLFNNLYRNDGGNYVTMTAATAGPIAEAAGNALGNTWGDYDNDGDLDCLVSRASAGGNQYFVNNGDGTFTQDGAIAIAAVTGATYGAVHADYDSDGDLDFFLSGPASSQGLYRNDTAPGNNWINIKCVGAGAPGGSNLSALGTKVRAKAIIGGNPVWQRREVSAQNAFNSMSMLNVHFGLGDASIIDTLIIEWPAGGSDVLVNLGASQFITVQEQITTGMADTPGLPRRAVLFPNTPNPFNPTTNIAFEMLRTAPVSLKVYDSAGREVRDLIDGIRAAGRHVITWNGRNNSGSPSASGVYFYRMETGFAEEGRRDRFTETRKMTLVR